MARATAHPAIAFASLNKRRRGDHRAVPRFLYYASAGILAVGLALMGPAAALAAGSPERVAYPPHRVRDGATATYQSGYQPFQLWTAYGFSSLSCNGSGGNTCGSGQIIAIVDAYDDPSAESDLATFNAQFGLPACTTTNGCFIKATPQGTPRVNGSWALEISLDIEWAHSIAPGAKILLVEAASNSFSNLLSAVDYAVQHGAGALSMSWGAGEFASETGYDYHFQASGVTFAASSGDNGTGTLYPASSPYVTAVGGTNLPLDASGNLTGAETAWSGSGGGISLYETEPGYQTSYGITSSNGMRGVPDVSYDADPNTGVAVYDSTSYFGQTGWFVVGGTSAGAPQWAALVAIANSQRSTPLSGANSSLYPAATGTAYVANYRDITSGSNGGCGFVCTAGPGYDFVTGLGSPLAGSLVPALAPSTSKLAFSTTPQTLTAGSPSGPMQVQLQSSSGATLTATANVSVALSSSSSSGSFSTSSAGPWSASLSVTITAGTSTSPSFYYQDTRAGSPTLSASATGYASGTQTETVNAGPLASILVSPASATVTQGGTQTFTASGSDAYGNPVSVSNAAWSVSPSALGTVAPTTGSSTSFTASSTTTGSGQVIAAVGTIAGSASVTVNAPAPISPPTNVAASPQGHHITLSWTGSAGAASYNLYRGLASGGETLYATGITTTAVNDMNVTGGVTYYYYVTAVSSSGAQSGPSNEASARAN